MPFKEKLHKQFYTYQYTANNHIMLVSTLKENRFADERKAAKIETIFRKKQADFLLT